ncbi:hypothetical protein ACNOYE_22400 [Nannocystaceae bacterium ST9]
MCRRRRGPTSNQFPAALACVPMVWDYLGTLLDMQLLGGFVGVQQHPITLELAPAIGWAVRERQR